MPRNIESVSIVVSALICWSALSVTDSWRFHQKKLYVVEQTIKIFINQNVYVWKVSSR